MAANNNHFGLTLDTVAPRGNISAEAFYNAQGKLTLTYDSDASQMKVWFNTSAEGSKTDEAYPTEWEAVAKEKNTAFVADGTYYYHVVYKDAVANESQVFNSGAIVYETAAASITSVAINDNASYTKSRTGNKIAFVFTTALSDIASVTLSGNIVGSPVIVTLTAEEIAAKKATRTFDFTAAAAQGNQTVTVTLTTAAGNTSSASDSITLDTTSAEGVLTLRTANNSANLPSYINYVAIGARIDCTADDWHSYKLTGPFKGSPLSGTVTANEKTNKYVFKTLTLNAGDGKKTIEACIYDNAGNETVLTSAMVTLDQTPPVITITPSRTILSRQSSYNSSVLTLKVTETGSGQKSHRIWLDTDTALTSDNTALPGTYTITAESLATEGKHTVHVEVTDDAGNVGTASVDLTLDITAPSVTKPTITNKGGYIGGNAVDTAADFVRLNQIVVTSGASDTHTISKCYCWINNKAADNALPTSAALLEGAKTTFAYSDIKTDTISEGAANYVHVAYIDEVGNAAYGHSAAVIIDTTVPAAGSISGLPAICHKLTNSISLTPSDTNISAGKGWYKLWGDIEATTEATAEWVAYEGSSVSITFTGASASATKTLHVKWRDAAGNVQTAEAATATTQLDTEEPLASLVLVDVNDAASIDNSKRSVNTFKARVSGTDDSDTGKATAYILYGNIRIGSTTYPTALKAYDAATSYAIGDFVTNRVGGQEQIRKVTKAGAYGTWAALTASSTDAFLPLTYATGKSYYLTDTITGTVTQGANPVYLKVRDDAGNVSAVVTKQFIYDTAVPIATIGQVDRHIVSKVHERLEVKDTYISNDASASSKEGYADYVAFTFTANEKVTAWKVCAYLNQAAAEQGSANDAAIPTTHGSINTSGAGIEANASIAVLLNGADYEKALGEVGKVDGAHFVVVYVKDEAGTWSSKAIFA